VDLSETGDLHRVSWEGGGEVRARWVIDASGRGKVIKRKLELAQPKAIRHGSTFCWVGRPGGHREDYRALAQGSSVRPAAA
jgi:flavin-dependent dehydrogenase